MLLFALRQYGDASYTYWLLLKPKELVFNIWARLGDLLRVFTVSELLRWDMWRNLDGLESLGDYTSLKLFILVY